MPETIVFPKANDIIRECSAIVGLTADEVVSSSRKTANIVYARSLAAWILRRYQRRGGYAIAYLVWKGRKSSTHSTVLHAVARIESSLEVPASRRIIEALLDELHLAGVERHPMAESSYTPSGVPTPEIYRRFYAGAATLWECSVDRLSSLEMAAMDLACCVSREGTGVSMSPRQSLGQADEYLRAALEQLGDPESFIGLGTRP